MVEVPSFREIAKSKSKDLFLSPSNVVKLGPENFKSLERLWKNNEHEPYISSLFGNFELEEILYNSYLSLGVRDKERNIVAVMVLGINPNVPVVSPGDWEQWIINLYGLINVNSYNSLWIRLIIWDPHYFFLFMKPIVHYLFNSIIELRFLLMDIPPVDCPMDFLENLGINIKPKGVTAQKCQCIYLMPRQSFVSSYRIRGAVEEDNEYIVKLVEKYSKKLTDMYGKYYIAELLTRFHDEKRKMIVAEYKNMIVGVLSLYDDINYQLLLNEFEIRPYNGLKKPHPQDLENFSPEEFLLYSPSFEQLFHPKDVEDLADFIIKKSVAVDPTDEAEILFNITRTDSDNYSLVFTSSALYFYQDDYDEITDALESNAYQERSRDPLPLHIFDQFLPINRKSSSAAYIGTTRTTYQVESRGKMRHPEFLGEPNAFALEILAAHPNHEECLPQLFGCAYDCFPNKEYCVMTISSTEETGFLSEYFAKVPPRYDGLLPHQLYIMHKNTVLGHVSVKEMQSKHGAQIKCLLSTIPNSTFLWYQLDKAMQDETAPVYCYVMLCENTVIGVAILIEEFDYANLQTHYNLYPMSCKYNRSGSQGLVENLVVSPIFQKFSDYFVRELHRLSEFEALYYKLKPTENYAVFRDRPLNNMLNRFLPVMPLHMPENDFETLKAQDYNVNESVFEEQDVFALYVSTLLTCSMKTYTVNKKIVIVGNSNTALSFIECLLFSKSLYYKVIYTNITLVISSQGLNHSKVSNKVRDSFLIKKHFLDERYLDALNLKTYINTVTGKISEIRRKEQAVILNEQMYLPYDLLFLMTGESFQNPMETIKSSFQLLPENVYIINTAADVSSALKKFKSLNAKFNFKIIVYGHFLQAYVTLGGLLSFGIPGRHLVFIEPFPFNRTIGKRHMHNVSIFNDPDIEQAVYTQIQEEGVEIYSSYYFIDWEYDENENIIQSVKFESRHKMLNMRCIALFFFGEKDVQYQVATVLQSAGLVYDGRLVIDQNYQTNDPKIYAAGTLTKYSRKYNANHLNHKYFNRSEIGKHLAEKIKNMLLPEEVLSKETKPIGWNFHIPRGKNLVPRYEKPIMRYCKLPGDLYYFSVVKPGRRVPLETALGMEDYGQVFITGNLKNLSEQGLFRLHINQNGRVETITCLTKFPIDIQNLYCLWDKHESMLNHLKIRFEMVLIKDLFHYFKEPWALVLYHPKFQDLLNYFNMLMTSIVEREGDSIVHKVIKALKANKMQALTEQQYNELTEDFKRLSYKDIIEQKVLEFIEEHLHQLAVYAHPKVIVSLLKGYQLSHLFY